MNKIINICFSLSAGETFKHAVSNKDFKDNQRGIVLLDDLSEGSIEGGVNIDERINWYHTFNVGDQLKPYADVDYDIDELKANYHTFYDEISKVDSSDTLYLWYGSSREFCGMLYALELLKNRSLNIYLINVKDTVIKRNDSVFQARAVGEIIPENIEKYAAAKRKLELNEYKKLLDIWEALKKDDCKLRILKDGKVESVDENYYDMNILEYTPKEFRNPVRTIGDVLGRSEHSISDDYIFWRIKELIKAGKIEYSGKLGILGMKIKITEEGMKYLSTDKRAMKNWEEERKASEEEEERKNKYREQGRMEERMDIAKKLKGVLDKEAIADKTGLTIEQIEGLEESYE